MSTPEASAMRDIVAASADLLEAAGFRKRRHAFNRTTEDGLVHVVHFWMAPKEPPAWTEVPGLRERPYGKFRLDFGVYVPEMTRMGAPVSRRALHTRLNHPTLESPGVVLYPDPLPGVRPGAPEREVAQLVNPSCRRARPSLSQDEPG